MFKIGYNVSFISVDLPLPETPQTPEIDPIGIFTFIFFKLFPEQPTNFIKLLNSIFDLLFLKIFSSPFRYLL